MLDKLTSEFDKPTNAVMQLKDEKWEKVEESSQTRSDAIWCDLSLA